MTTTNNTYKELRTLLRLILLDKNIPVLSSFTNDFDLVDFLNEAFEERQREQKNK